MQQPVGVMQPHWQQALAAPLAWSAIAQETRVALVAALLPLLALALLAWQPCRGATRSARRECAPLPSGSCKAQAAALLPPQPSPQPRLSESADDILVNARASSCSASNVGITAAAAPAPPLLSAAAAGMPLTAPVTGAAAAGPGLERLMCQLQAMCPTNQSHPGSAALYTRNVRHVGVHVKLFEHHSPATSSGTAAAASSDAVYMEQAAHAHAVVRHALHQLPQQWQVLMMATFPGWVHVSAQLVLQGEAAAAEAAAAAVAAAVEAVLPPEGAAASAAAAPSVATLPLEQQAAAMRGLWWEPAALPAGPTPSMVNVTLPHQLVSGVERTRCGLRAVVCDAAAQAAGEVTPLIDHTQWPGDAWWPAGGAPLLLQIPGSAAGSQLLLLHLLRAAPAAAAAAGDENGGGGGVGALLATVPLLVLPQAACDELELLRAAVLCRWRIQHPGATQAQAVAAVACSQMQFAYDYAMLLHRGVAGQGHALSQEVLAYLACNQLAACLQLLDDGDSPLAVQAQQPISRGRSGESDGSVVVVAGVLLAWGDVVLLDFAASTVVWSGQHIALLVADMRTPFAPLALRPCLAPQVPRPARHKRLSRPQAAPVHAALRPGAMTPHQRRRRCSSSASWSSGCGTRCQRCWLALRIPKRKLPLASGRRSRSKMCGRWWHTPLHFWCQPPRSAGMRSPLGSLARMRCCWACICRRSSLLRL